MILGIGTDIIEVARVKRALAQKGFKEKVYSEKEIEYCERDENGLRFAARYAAKEAFAKAMGTGWLSEVEINAVEVLNDEKGKPFIFLSGKALEIFRVMNGGVIQVSLSHIKEAAIAFVVVEYRQGFLKHEV